jgi:hypothetical protein
MKRKILTLKNNVIPAKAETVFCHPREGGDPVKIISLTILVRLRFKM